MVPDGSADSGRPRVSPTVTQAAGPQRRCAILFTMGLLAFLSVSNVLLSLPLSNIFRPFYVSAALFSLAVSALALLRHMKAAVKVMEVGFALLILVSALYSTNRGYGASLAFLPAFSLLCLYFDGSRTLAATNLFAGATCLAWYLAVGREHFSPGATLTHFTLLFYMELLIYLVASDLHYALLDSRALLMELNHRIRNLLQILQSLALHAEHRQEDRGALDLARAESSGGGALAFQVEALQGIGESLSLHSDFHHVSMAAPFVALVRIARSMRGIHLEADSRALLPFDKAVKLILFLSEILEAEGNRAPGRRLALTLSADEKRAILFIDGRDDYGLTPEAWSRSDDPVGILLRQLDARLTVGVGNSSLRIDFDATEGPSVLDDSPGDLPRFADRFRMGEWKPFLGKLNRRKSRVQVKKAWTLLLYLTIELVLFSMLFLYSFIVSHTVRISSAVMIGISAIAIFLLRRGSLRLAPVFFVGAGGLAVLYAVFRGPDSGMGLQLVSVQMFFLMALHFLGKREGLLMAAWGGIVYGAWFFWHPEKTIPLTVFQTFCVSLVFFYIIAFIIVQDIRKDVEGTKAVALHFMGSLGLSIGLLSAAEGEAASSYRDRLKRQISIIASAHTIVTGTGDLREMEVAPAFRAYAASLSSGHGKPELRMDVTAKERLPSETVYYLLLALGELWGRCFDDAAHGAGGLYVSLARSGRNLIFSARLVDPTARCETPDCWRSPFLDSLVTRLGAERLAEGQNEYRLDLGPL